MSAALAIPPERPSWEEYLALDRVNWSSLKNIGRSPLHYKHALDHGRPDTASLKRGRAAHVATFEPDTFDHAYVVWEGGVRRGKAWDAFRLEHADREILTVKEADAARRIADAVHRHPAARNYVTNGLAESTVTWSATVDFCDGVDPMTIACKGRLDFIAMAARSLVDLKTTRHAGPAPFAEATWRYGYHAQAAFYSDGFARATGQQLPFRLIAVESEPPHAVQVYRVPDAVLEKGREEYRELLVRLATCRAERRWPSYADDEMELELPRRVMPLDEDDLDGLDLEFGSDAEET